MKFFFKGEELDGIEILEDFLEFLETEEDTKFAEELEEKLYFTKNICQKLKEYGLLKKC